MSKQYVAEHGQRIIEATVIPHKPKGQIRDLEYHIRIGSKTFTFQVLDQTPGRQTVLCSNKVIRLNDLRRDIQVFSVRDHRLKSISELASGSASGEILKAPMPGKVVKLLKAEGDAVTAGEGILVMEAMKMQNELKAKTAGTVSRIHVSEGSTVESKDVLVEIS